VRQKAAYLGRAHQACHITCSSSRTIVVVGEHLPPAWPRLSQAMGLICLRCLDSVPCRQNRVPKAVRAMGPACFNTRRWRPQEAARNQAAYQATAAVAAVCAKLWEARSTSGSTCARWSLAWREWRRNTTTRSPRYKTRSQRYVLNWLSSMSTRKFSNKAFSMAFRITCKR
jgi:hypothetical protein